MAKSGTNWNLQNCWCGCWHFSCSDYSKFLFSFSSSFFSTDAHVLKHKILSFKPLCSWVNHFFFFLFHLASLVFIWKEAETMNIHDAVKQDFYWKQKWIWSFPFVVSLVESESPIERSGSEICGHLPFTFAKHVFCFCFWPLRCYPILDQNAKKKKKLYLCTSVVYPWASAEAGVRWLMRKGPCCVVRAC